MLRTTKGFTLIELLIVVVIIGILAAIAIPKFASTKEKAYLATMKSDLKNFVTAEESYFADNNIYGSYAAVNGAGLFTSSKDVTIVAANVTATGWNATSTHTGAPTKTCGVYVGAAGAPAGAPAGIVEGEVACW
jgi:type IV pilus assembly protein PilA